MVTEVASATAVDMKDVEPMQPSMAVDLIKAAWMIHLAPYDSEEQNARVADFRELLKGIHAYTLVNSHKSVLVEVASVLNDITDAAYESEGQRLHPEEHADEH